jgi:hypothetical protein
MVSLAVRYCPLPTRSTRVNILPVCLPVRTVTEQLEQTPEHVKYSHQPSTRRCGCSSFTFIGQCCAVLTGQQFAAAAAAALAHWHMLFNIQLPWNHS